MKKAYKVFIVIFSVGFFGTLGIMSLLAQIGTLFSSRPIGFAVAGMGFNLLMLLGMIFAFLAVKRNVSLEAWPTLPGRWAVLVSLPWGSIFGSIVFNLSSYLLDVKNEQNGISFDLTEFFSRITIQFLIFIPAYAAIAFFIGNSTTGKLSNLKS
ncbi:hypothetical protein [Arthrobacter russicus]|uniref:Uncharacterized protein n=1 Tax=Arthrobacter russicus TaxID=172040 RepID=A0ABU1JEZ1_9MICC|nr:hypothetical protein [Arthrobacter russicus]MDR6270421.1 hypothetical protein [Arthrobacter russicus]